MKKTIIFCICFFIVMCINDNKVYSTDYYARSYIVIDYNTGEILESKDKDLVRSVASISKIMTAILAIEYASLDMCVEVNDDILKAYGSSIYLKQGEVVKMEDLLYGLMLRSGNDAAVTIARGVSGSVDKFVELMNNKAKEIGMKNSTFYNPSGLDVDDEGNLSTSYDMALLMKYAMSNDTFRKITGTKEYKSTNHGLWINKNKLLRQYKYTSGGKTGFTTKARRTLVTSAKKEEMELIIVTLDCGGDFAMHKLLYEKYFNNYKTFKLLKKGSNVFEEYELICDKSINVTVDREKLINSRVIYKISNNFAKVILEDDKESSQLGECSVIKHNKVNKKSWWRRIFRK